jgi:hypothetical protein
MHVGGGHGVESGGLQIILYNQPITRCHVAAHDWATWHRTTNQILPCVVIHPHLPIVCHSALPSVVRITTSTSVWTVWTVQSASLFLPICHFEQNAISLTPDVHLNPKRVALGLYRQGLWSHSI